ncbi:MAG: ATP-binding protein [Chloroflexota bacterium]
MNRSQKPRLLLLILYIIGLFATSRIAFGTWVPPPGPEGLWFYSGVAALLLGNLIVTPFYVKPADALSYAVAALIALYATQPAAGQESAEGLALWALAMAYMVVVVTTSVAAMALRRRDTAGKTTTLSTAAYVLSDRLGSPRLVFSVVYLYAIVEFHAQSPRELIVLGVAWALFVAFQPLEALADILRQIRGSFTSTVHGELIGRIAGLQTPGLVLIRLADDSRYSRHELLLVSAAGTDECLAMALDIVGYSEGTWIRAAILECAESTLEPLAKLAKSAVAPGNVLRIPREIIDRDSIADPLWCRRDELVGLVAPNSDIGLLRLEITADDHDFQQGMLLETTIGDRPALYQVTNGLTQEELIQHKNTHGFVRADAERVGHWDHELARFDPVAWVPRPNAGVFIAQTRALAVPCTAVGCFPGTDYSVSIDVDKLVTHSAAILGILGIGKSYLGMELVERMIDAGVKVVLVDLTNQYGDTLSGLWDKEHDTALESRLQQLGIAGKGNVSRNVEEGGSAPKFAEELRGEITSFLATEQTSRSLCIINPSRYEVWVQDSKPFNNLASMASLTPPEITRIVAEAVLSALQAQGMSKSARCCIVLEEAHALTPEWNSVASDRDREATNGTARAILQGRKYGMGCLLITQRTANVTKTILNQCNTLFAMRSYDATGMDFLANYVGKRFAQVVCTLRDRHAIVFGRASSCPDPVLVRLNDRSDFIRSRQSQEIAETTIPD